MPDQPPTASGSDLARQALAAARANAKTKPVGKPKKRRPTMVRHGGGRDPIALSSLLDTVATEQGWQEGMDGGNLIADWRKICPTALVDTLTPVGYDPERGQLTVRPAHYAAATNATLMQRQLVKHLNDQLGRPVVRTLRVLPPGAPSAVAADEAPAPAPVLAEPKTRATASAGYRQTLEAHLQARPEHPPTDPYLLEAIARQDAALRAHRLPDPSGVRKLETPDEATVRHARSEAAQRAALAYKRSEQRNGPAPVRRAFDVA